MFGSMCLVMGLRARQMNKPKICKNNGKWCVLIKPNNNHVANRSKWRSY